MITLSINNILMDVRTTNFSDGAVSVKIAGAIPQGPQKALITVKSEGKLNGELFEVASLVGILRDINPRIRIELFMPYGPYARQDRRMVQRDAFSLKTYANILNSLQLDKVYVMDSHSTVLPALVDNCVDIPQSTVLKLIKAINAELGTDTIVVSPDMGAVKKASEAVYAINATGIAYLNKTRNPATGAITGMEMMGGGSASGLRGRNLLIVDDLCDGGATFIHAAKLLREFEPNTIQLYVTHGIFSRGTDEMLSFGRIDRIWTTDSIKHPAANINRHQVRVTSVDYLFEQYRRLY